MFSEKKFIAFSFRKTNIKEFLHTEHEFDGRNSYEVDVYSYSDPLLKGLVLEKNSESFKSYKNELKTKNSYIEIRKYIYLETAIIDGYLSKKSASTFQISKSYYFEILERSISTVIIFYTLITIIFIVVYFKNKIEEDEKI